VTASAVAPANVCLVIDGVEVTVARGTSVAAAIAHAGAGGRRSVLGQPRAPLCGMGICFECRATIDGHAQRRTCLVPAANGMVVVTDG